MRIFEIVTPHGPSLSRRIELYRTRQAELKQQMHQQRHGPSEPHDGTAGPHAQPMQPAAPGGPVDNTNSVAMGGGTAGVPSP